MKKIVLFITPTILFFGCNDSKKESDQNNDNIEVKEELQVDNCVSQVFLNDSISVEFEDFENVKGLSIIVHEYNKPSEIIFEKLNTMSTDGLLESKSMFKIDIVDEIGERKSIEDVPDLKIKSKSRLNDYGIYYKEDDCESRWEIDTTSYIWDYVYDLDKAGVIIDSTPRWRYDNLFNLNKLGWVNIDKLLVTESNVDLKISLSQLTDASVAEVNIVFLNKRSLVKASNKIDGGFLVNVPSDEDIIVVTHYKRNGSYYYNIQKSSTSVNEIEIGELLEVNELLELKGLIAKEVDKYWDVL